MHMLPSGSKRTMQETLQHIMREILNKIMGYYWWIPTSLFSLVSILYFTDVIDYGKIDIYIIIFCLIYIALSIIWNFVNRKFKVGLFQLVIGTPSLIVVLFIFVAKFVKGYY